MQLTSLGTQWLFLFCEEKHYEFEAKLSRCNVLREIVPLLTTGTIAWVAFAFVSSAWEGIWTVNFILSIVLASTLSVGAMLQAQADRAYLFTAVFWFRIATAVYFGIGNMVPYLVSEERALLLRANYHFTDYEIFHFNLIVYLGVLIVLIVNSISERGFGSIFKSFPLLHKSSTLNSLPAAMVLFLAVGFAVRFVLLIPAALVGVEFAIPGFVRSLALLFYAGVFLLSLGVLRGKRRWRSALIILCLFDLSFSMATFAKTELLLLGLIISLAYLYHRFSLRRVIGCGMLLLVLYSLSVPFVDFGRERVFEKYGALYGASFVERIAFSLEYFVAEERSYDTGERSFDNALARLSYVNVSTFLMDRYDNGFAGQSYWNVVYSLVPRVLWEDKPLISNQGMLLAILFQGIDTTSTGSGIFSEAYWNNGYPGVFLGLTLYGIMISLLSQLSRQIVGAEQWFFLPVALASVEFGIRVDGVLANDGTGKFVIVAALFALLVLIAPFFYGMVRGASSSSSSTFRSKSKNGDGLRRQ